MELHKHIDELKVIFGPLFLALGVILYISPTLDKIERPETERGLKTITGEVVTSSRTKYATFIYVRDGYEEHKIKVFCKCQDQQIGKIVKVKTGDNIIRTFDIAWRLESEGKLIYNLQSVKKMFQINYEENSGIRFSFLCIGLLMTPYWFFTRKNA